MKRELKILDGGTPESLLAEDNQYQDIINQHFTFIEKQCFKAVKLKHPDNGSTDNTLNIENEALELCNLVIDTLRRDNFKIIRNFKGNSKMTTYLTAIISRQAVDLIRKKLGRNREKERAMQLGEIGLILYQKVIKNNQSLREVYDELLEQGHSNHSMDQLTGLLEVIKGNDKKNLIPVNGNGSAVKAGVVVAENQYVVPDRNSNPADLLAEKQRREHMQKAMQGVLNQLSGEERILLRMRFPCNENEKPQSVEQVSKVLGISPKAVYKRVTRLMEKCRKSLQKEGVTPDDLL